MRAVLDARYMLGRPTGPLPKLLLGQPQLFAAAAQCLVQASRIEKDLGLHVWSCLVMNG